MADKRYLQIKQAYDNFYKGLLSKGKLPMWSTSRGFWNASVSDEVFETFRKLRLGRFKNFLDLGSGDGKIVLIASLFCRMAEGIEIDRQLHQKAEEMKSRLAIKNATLHNKDFFEHDISGYDAIFIAPDAPFERGVEKKLLKEMKGKLIHYGPHFQPQHLKKEDSFSVNGTMVTIYSKILP
jgi:predicted TPR repeat methyltransferase